MTVVINLMRSLKNCTEMIKIKNSNSGSASNLQSNQNSDLDLTRFKKVHFIGIGGIGVSAIAKMMLNQGKSVSGSDVSESPITLNLAKSGATVHIGQRASNVPPEADLVVYTVAIKEDNPELVEARRRGLRSATYPEVLGVISKEKFTIAVAGSHGKTTTTAMIADVLIDAGFDPTVIVGSLMKSTGTNYVVGKSKFLILEACEYRRSFLNINSKISVITNIDDDHLDYYRDLAGVQKGFREFVERLPADGKLICDLDGKNMLPVVSNFSENDNKKINYAEISDSDIPKLKIPGRHNIENAKVALSVALLVGVEKSKAIESLKKFSGTWRRFEFLGKTKNGTEIYDDYAHHPTEIRATITTACEFFSDKKITVVFQPHLYSRTKEHLEEFAECFVGIDEVIVAPIYAAREPTDPNISSEILAERMQRSGVNAISLSDFVTIEKHLNEKIFANIDTKDSKRNVIITMGAGDVNSVALAMLK